MFQGYHSNDGETIEGIDAHQKLSTTSKTSLTATSIRGFVTEAGLKCKKRKILSSGRGHIE